MYNKSFNRSQPAEGKTPLKEKWSNFFSSSGSIPPVPLPAQWLQQDSSQQKERTSATFMAFVDAIIPSTLGALDLRLDEYVIWSLDHYVSLEVDWGVERLPLSIPVSQLLDVAALQLLAEGRANSPLDLTTYPLGGPFSSLAPTDRIWAIDLLEQDKVDLEHMPAPFRNNSGLVKNIVSALHQMVLFGYYSDWFSYGATRLANPEDRRVERKEIVWNQTKYPGPSYAYRAFRGYLVKSFQEGGESQ
ncbi:hypothetical protein [Alteribacillus iranensis]|uniref:Uncharacterized protein n=1 Tax=Alteribacillus iranensis TaxID=930128 RepID=A0A1I2EV33_9BACI|nr:hypothetical protein [Alteribacillus iranensis]SFE96715.1 hypothetical protein SAMN05192532_10718 [Alteribacillus iranensis]